MIIVHYQSQPGSAGYGLLKGSMVYELAGHDIFTLPKEGVPGAGGPEAGGPEAGGPEAGGPEAGGPEAGGPEAGVPETGALIGPIEALQLLPPVWPGKIVALGRNYIEHAREHGAEVPAQPLLFLKAPSSVVGPGQPVVLTPLSEQVEYEAELAVVIGRRCKAVPEAEAWDVVLGVTCANDVTARDLQRRDGQWARSKSFDSFCPLGPHLVTHLSPERLEHLDVTCRVNGRVCQHGNTAEMVFKIPYLIAYITAGMTLLPGDVILTGTPAGVGPLHSGDVVEVEVEGVGLLRNPVVNN